MIRLASTKPHLAKSEKSPSDSTSSAYDSSSSDERNDSPPKKSPPTPPPPSPQRAATVSTAPAPTIENSLPIWEDYMPDIQKNIEELTRALGGYIENNKRKPRSASSSSSSASGSEDKPVAPPPVSSKTEKKGKSLRQALQQTRQKKRKRLQLLFSPSGNLGPRLCPETRGSCYSWPKNSLRLWKKTFNTKCRKVEKKFLPVHPPATRGLRALPPAKRKGGPATLDPALGPGQKKRLLPDRGEGEAKVAPKKWSTKIPPGYWPPRRF